MQHFLIKLIVLIALFSLSGVAFAQPTTTSLDIATREKVFEIVWGRINERFFDPKFNGVDWELMRRRYQPRAAQAKTDDEFYELLRTMLGELKQSHIGIIPPAVYVEEEKPAESANTSGVGTAGITVQLVEGKPTFTKVEPGSGGANAGLRPGFVLTTINGKPVDELLERIRKRVTIPRDFPTTVYFALSGMLDGPVGSAITVGYLDGDDKPQTATLKRTAYPGTLSQFGELPPLPVRVEKKRLENNIGYLSLSIWLIPVLEPMQQAVQEFADAPGLIIDVRGNRGGLGPLATSLARWFYDKPTNLGTMHLRNGNVNFLTNPPEKIYKKPVVILTDEGSVSTSEILAGGMQETKRAVVIGTPTAGQVLPSVVEQLPGGVRFQYAFADFRTPKGVLLEGRGVQPDIPMPINRADLLAGRDAPLQAAIEYIRTQSQKGK